MGKRNPRRIGSYSALIGFWLVACASPYPGWPDPPPRTGLLTDYANVLDSASKQRIDSLLLALQEAAQIEFSILTVPSIGSIPISDYAHHVISKWGLESGLLLVISSGNGTFYFASSPDLDGDLPPDGGRMIAQRSLHQYEPVVGIERFVNLIIDSLQESRGFSLKRAGATNREMQQTVTTPHYRFEIPEGGSWSVEGPFGSSDAVLLTKQLEASDRGRTLVQIRLMRQAIEDPELVKLSAKKNADEIRNIEKQVMLEQGVKPGLYRLHDVSMGEEVVAGRQFYLMDYRTETVTDLQFSSLYLFFPHASQNEWFIMAHYTEVAPKEIGPTEYSKMDLLEVLRTLELED